MLFLLFAWFSVKYIVSFDYFYRNIYIIFCCNVCWDVLFFFFFFPEDHFTTIVHHPVEVINSFSLVCEFVFQDCTSLSSRLPTRLFVGAFRADSPKYRSCHLLPIIFLLCRIRKKRNTHTHKNSNRLWNFPLWDNAWQLVWSHNFIYVSLFVCVYVCGFDPCWCTAHEFLLSACCQSPDAHWKNSSPAENPLKIQHIKFFLEECLILNSSK